MEIVQDKGQIRNQETINVDHFVIITVLALQEESSHTQAWWQTDHTRPHTHTHTHPQTNIW